MDEAETAVLSIVIPALDCADSLARTLAALAATGDAGVEVVVVDGGSSDRTRGVATAAGARVLRAEGGRGAQLAFGAGAARGDCLLFLHADTVPGPGWAEATARFTADLSNRRRAAYFRFALGDPAPAARRLERVVAWRARVLGLPYGDQGLLLGRQFYEDIGGFKPMPLMEDVDMARRIGRRNLVSLDVPAVTSAARYRAGGYVARPLRNLTCLGLYFLGLPPALIARIYR